MEFENKSEATDAFHNGYRNFNGEKISLERWSTNLGSISVEEKVTQAWVRIVGLLLQLWSIITLRRIREACGGFLEMDKQT